MTEDTEQAPRVEPARRRPSWTRPVEPPWRGCLLRGLLQGAIASALFWGYHFALVWRDGDGPLFWAVVVWIPCFFAALFFAFLMVPKSTRRVSAGRFVACAIYVAIGLASPKIDHRIRVARLEHVVRDVQPLVDALRAYEAQHGGAPDHLEDLVPEFLAAIPTTGLSGCPEITYWRRRPQFEGPGWELRIPGPLQPGQDTLIYWSDSNYPPEVEGALTTPVGDWMYSRRRFED